MEYERNFQSGWDKIFNFKYVLKINFITSILFLFILYICFNIF